VLTFPRETVEYLPTTFAVDGVTTDTYDVAVVPYDNRPTAWIPAPYLLEGPVLGPGTFDAYGRAVDNPETPVIHLGTFVIS
jgi:hypothetical protein